MSHRVLLLSLGILFLNLPGASAFAEICELKSPIPLGTNDPRGAAPDSPRLRLGNVLFDQELKTEELAPRLNGKYQLELFRIFTKANHQEPKWIGTEAIGVEVKDGTSLLGAGFSQWFLGTFSYQIRNLQQDGYFGYETTHVDTDVNPPGPLVLQAKMWIRDQKLEALSLVIPIYKRTDQAFVYTGFNQNLCVRSAEKLNISLAY